jgi:hypothetical protein
MRVGRQVTLELLVRDVELEPVAEGLERLRRQLLHLVDGVAGLEVGPERPSLDRLREDDGRRPGRLHGSLEGGVHLAVVVATAGQLDDVVVGEVLDELAEPRVRPEEVVADEVTGLDRVGLHLPVGDLVHPVDEHAVHVPLEQVVPLAAPHDLDDVPSRPAEDALELLDDLAVAAHRAVELLQVAVDDEGQVVEPLAGRHGEGTERFGLGGLAVPAEEPHVLVGGVLEPAVLEVAVETRLVDRVEGSEAHRDRGELPEVGHQPRVRVARQPAWFDLGTEAVEPRLVHPSLEERAGVDARGGVTLEVDLVAATGVVLAPEEVVEPDLVERRRRRVGADVPARPALDVGAVDHHGRVPADVAPDAPFELLVPGEARFTLGRDRVDVVGRRQRRDPDVALAGPLEDLQEEEAPAAAAVLVDHRVEGLEPLAGLDLVDVGVLRRQTVGDDRLVTARDEVLLLSHLGHGCSSPSRGSSRCCEESGWPP